MHTRTLKLLGTAHCHLCEQAEAMLESLCQQGIVQETNTILHKIDIIDHDDLYSSYGIKIPVLIISTGRLTTELNWPFTEEDLLKTLEEHASAYDNKKAS